MHTYRLALIGFGGVTRAFAQLVADGPERFHGLGFDVRVTAISDLMMGSLVQPEGIDLVAALAMPRGATFEGLPGGSSAADNEEIIRNGSVDVVVEATFTNPLDGEPAASHVRWALESGKHVATTNKGPVALHGAQLTELARVAGLRFAYEGAVMSGTPVLGLARDQLAGLAIDGFEGILNGTSNYVLHRMGEGLSLKAAVAEAQALGYAEADPSADIGGSDVQLKVAILANELLGAALAPYQVPTTGITNITADDVAAAALEGRVWKLVGSACRTDDGQLRAQVRPVALAPDHPLAGVAAATNAISFHTDLLGAVTITGPGAGRVETAYALICDLVSIHAAEQARAHGAPQPQIPVNETTPRPGRTEEELIHV